MEFMNGLFGAAGCNPDGTIGQNAFTGLIDRTMESHIFDGHLGGSGSEVGPMSFMESTSMQSYPLVNGQGSVGVVDAPMGFPAHMPMHMPMMMTPPLMVMPQAYPSFNHRGHHFSQAQQQNLYHDGYFEDQEHTVEEFEEGLHEDADYDVDQAMMEQLMGENDLINGTTIVVDDYDEDHELFAPSNTGYKNAWNRLEENLENGQLSAMNVPHTVTADGRVYCFQQENSQMHNHASDGQKNLEEIFEQGMEYYREGRIQSAIQSFEAVVQQADETSSVNIAESWRMIGLCHTENDEDKVAIVCFIKAVENDSYHLDALLALGTCYMNELDSFKALETLKAWVAHNPSFAGLEVPQDAYSDGSLMDEVMQLMLAVSEYAPTDMDVQVVLGVLYNISNDYSNAVSCFHQALRHNPTSYNLLNKIAATLANGGRSEEALPYYAKALQQRPGFARAWMNLGISYSNLNSFDAASKAYVQALHLSPSAKHIWGYLRVVLNSMERPDLVEQSAKENIDQLAVALKVDLIMKQI